MAGSKRQQSRAIATAAAASDPPSGDENETSGAVPGKAPRTERFNWPQDLKIQLLEVADREEFRVVLRGRQNASDNARPSGKTKTSAYGDMAKILLPDLWKKDAIAARKKVQSQYETMTKLHKQLNNELNATGSGVGGDQEHEALQEVELEGYVGADGPTASTALQLVTKWDQLVTKCSFWPTLHRMFGTHPTQVPVATTTGLGPEGPRTTLHQKPSSPSLPSSPWNFGVGASAPAKPQADEPPALKLDSDVEILDHSCSPSPAVKGNGKGIDKRERGGKSVKAKEGTVKEGKPKEKDVREKGAKEKDAKEKDVKEKVKAEKVKGEKVKGEKVKGEKVKEEKPRAPRLSSNFEAASSGNTSGSTSGSSGGRKRKSADEGLLGAMHESMTERYKLLDARHERERADARYKEDMDRHERTMGTMPMSIYCQRQNEIRVQYGLQPLTIPNYDNYDPPQTPVARVQPRAQPRALPPLQPHPRPHPGTQPRTRPFPLPETPTRRANDVIMISSSPIAIESSSPIKQEPSTTPIKQEHPSPTKEEVDELMDEHAEYAAFNNARDAPLFKSSAFDFQP